ncbi:MAG: response regulator with CheY-like receiver AAA-type ATPase and DNA-binding domain [bacterium]|nr:MAG: response regulator with CheY-like receiver AAA-type ATPase and DNA-binding domain [bacterium]
MEDNKAFTLVVDDEIDMCWALENILKTNGLCLKSAVSGQEALQLIKLYHFQLAFLDAKLPDIDGLELARLIKIANPTIPIMMISGYFYKDDVMVQKALSEDLICGFISKPFLHSEIIKVLKRFNSF